MPSASAFLELRRTRDMNSSVVAWLLIALSMGETMTLIPRNNRSTQRRTWRVRDAQLWKDTFDTLSQR